MALKVHGIPMSTSTARVLVALHEKEADYELVGVNMRVGEHKQPHFLAKNPFGLVPVLEDGDLTLFESRAITKYIAYKYSGQGTDLVRGGDEKEGALVNVWLEVEAQHFNPAAAPLARELLVKPKLMGVPTDEAAVLAHTEKLEKVLDAYEQRLSSSKYLAGDNFSLADLHHLPYLFALVKSPKASLISSRPHVQAWWEDISSRPAWVKTAQGMSFWG